MQYKIFFLLITMQFSQIFSSSWGPERSWGPEHYACLNIGQQLVNQHAGSTSTSSSIRPSSLAYFSASIIGSTIGALLANTTMTPPVPAATVKALTQTGSFLSTQNLAFGAIVGGITLYFLHKTCNRHR